MPFVQDKKDLIAILRFVDALLEQIVRTMSDPEKYYSNAWNEVRPRFQTLIQEIETIPSENVDRWQEIYQRGLTGNQLRLKMSRLRNAVSGNILERILKILNSILGSIPGGDFAKEFKDMAEDEIQGVQVAVPPMP